MLKNIKYQLELISCHNDEILNVKEDESKKGWNILHLTQTREKLISNQIGTSKSTVYKLLEMLAIPSTIAGVIWGIYYSRLNEIESPDAMKNSLILFTIIFVLISIILFVKKK